MNESLACVSTYVFMYDRNDEIVIICEMWLFIWRLK